VSKADPIKRGGRQEPYCCDCGMGTFAIDEWYMVTDDVWNQAWPGQHGCCYRELVERNDDDDEPLLFERLDRFVSKEAQEILCIGCLEKRIGRTLCRADFTGAPVNDPNRFQLSDRLRDRLAADADE